MLRLVRPVARLVRVARPQKRLVALPARCLHSTRSTGNSNPSESGVGKPETSTSTSTGANTNTVTEEFSIFDKLVSLATSDMDRDEAVRLVAAMMLHAEDQSTRDAISQVVQEKFGKWDTEEFFADVDEAMSGEVEEDAFESLYDSIGSDATDSDSDATEVKDPLALHASPEEMEAVQAELDESLALEGLDVELLDEFIEQMQSREVRQGMKEWSDEEKWEFSHLMSLIVNVNGGAKLNVLHRALDFLKKRDVDINLSEEVPEAMNQTPIPPTPPMDGVNPLELAQRRSDVDVDTMHVDEPEKEIDADPYPDLMTPDPLMDSRDEVEFPPSRDAPFRNKVVVRNHYSMFHEAMEKSGFDWSKPGDWQPTRSDLLEDDVTPAEAANLPPTFDPRKLMVYRLIERFTTQQTPKGKINHMQVFTVVGNGNGLLGLGVAKDKESGAASSKALVRALRNLDYVDRFESRTVWTEMETKFGACKVILRPRPVGFGLRCSPILHQILKAAGIKDVSAKIWGSRNPVMVMQAATRMLQGGHAPLGMGDGVGGKGRKRHKGTGMRSMGVVERERGRKLIPLRK